MSAPAQVAEGDWLVIADEDVPSDIDLACPGCKTGFSCSDASAQPLVLSCGHSLCTGCVGKGGQAINCPVCQVSTSTVTAPLPKNAAILGLLRGIASDAPESSTQVIDFKLVPSAELLALLGTDKPLRLSLPANTTLEALQAHVASLLPKATATLRPRLRHATTHKFLASTAPAVLSVCVGATDDLNASPPVIGRDTSWTRFFHLYRQRLLSPEQRAAETRVTCKGDRLLFGNTGFSIDLQRTLRLPMTDGDGKVHPLPPGLGSFSMVPLDAYRDKVPEAWCKQGGVIVPMQEAEAMWLNFSSKGASTVAIQVATGGINSVSGEIEADNNTSLRKQPQQNYLVSPPQPWLDGINAGAGVVKQFVAVSLGSHHTIEAQVKSRARQDQAAKDAAAAWFSTPPTPPTHMAEDESVGGIQLQVRPTLNHSFSVRACAAKENTSATAAPATTISPIFGYRDLMRTPAQLQMPIGTMLDLTSALLPGRTLTLTDWLGPQKTLLLEATHKVRLNLRTLMGTEIPLDVDPTDTIEHVKQMIQDKEGIPPDQQRLVWTGQQLEDGLTIGHYDIPSEAVVHILLRLRGGCFTGDTLVTTDTDGKQTRIDEVRVGDTVLVYHLDEKQQQTRIVSRVHRFDVNELATITCADGRTLRTTPGHAMRVERKGWAAVEPDADAQACIAKLQVGDVLCTTHGAMTTTIVSIERKHLDVTLPVYTLSIAPNTEDVKRHGHRAALEPSRVGDFELPYVNFFANGILVHNGSNGVKIWVRVALPNGEFLVVHAETDDSIGTLRSKINPHLGPSARLYSLFYNGTELSNQDVSLERAQLVQGCLIKVLIGSGVAAGAKIKQQIYEDTQPEGAWTDDADVCRVFVHLANAEMWRQITGRAMPPTPVSAETYARHRLPFFALWKEELACVAASNTLAGVLDLKQAILVTAPAKPLPAAMASLLDERPLDVPAAQQVQMRI
jgi:hypothetical protein